jgi:hypothetical protein
MRVVRGMLGMGLTFAAIAGAFFSVLAVIAGLTGAEDDPVFMIVAGSTWAFAIGVAFSGTLALAASRRRFDELSLPRVALLGAAGGLALAALLVGATWPEWTLADATVPFTFLPLLGAGSASASLLIARRVGPELGAGEESTGLVDGDAGPSIGSGGGARVESR